MSTARSRGFTLIEALVSIVILGVGIVGALATFGEMAHARGRAMNTERMHRLAFEKLDELLATGDYATPNLGGDFTDRGETRYNWRAEVSTTSVENLNSLSVVVEPAKTSGTPQSVKAVALVYVPPTTGTGSGTPGGTPGGNPGP